MEKTTMFIKPDFRLAFVLMDLIGIYIESKYDKANTLEELIDLVSECLTISDTTTNEQKKMCYESFAYRLHSCLTGRSYESTASEIINKINLK